MREAQLGFRRGLRELRWRLLAEDHHQQLAAAEWHEGGNAVPFDRVASGYCWYCANWNAAFETGVVIRGRHEEMPLLR
jgi:hypothetical protein